MYNAKFPSYFRLQASSPHLLHLIVTCVLCISPEVNCAFISMCVCTCVRVYIIHIVLHLLFIYCYILEILPYYK